MVVILPWYVYFLMWVAVIGLSWLCSHYYFVNPFENSGHVHVNVHGQGHGHVTRNDDHVISTIKEMPGIHPSVLRSIPTVDFDSKDFEDGVECVICLNELVDGDKARLLWTCNHWFHAQCIDKWLRSHSTCPICRKIVGSVPTSQHSPVVTQDLTAVVVEPPTSPSRPITSPN